MTHPASSPRSVPITVTVSVPPETSSSPCQDQCNKCSSHPCTCSHSKIIRLHRKDRKKLASIAKEIRIIATRIKAIETISANIDALCKSLKKISDDQSEQTTQLGNISRSAEATSQSLAQHTANQSAQIGVLHSIARNINSIPNAIENIKIPAVGLDIPSDTSQNIRSIANSLNSIKYLLPASLLLLAVATFSLPFILKSQSIGVPPTPTSTSTSTSAVAPSTTMNPTIIIDSTTTINSIYTPVVTKYSVTCLPSYEYLRIRQNPNLSAIVISNIPCNTSGVQIIGAAVDGDGETWAPIQYQTSGTTISGWVVRRFLSP